MTTVTNKVKAKNIAARNAAPVVGTYICDLDVCILHGEPTEIGRGGGHCWHESAWARLGWQYGEARASRIALGIDPAANRDLAAWNSLGSRTRAAA